MAAHVPGREPPAPVCDASSWGLMQSKALYLRKSGTGVMAEQRSQGPYSVPPWRGQQVGWKILLQCCLISGGSRSQEMGSGKSCLLCGCSAALVGSEARAREEGVGQAQSLVPAPLTPPSPPPTPLAVPGAQKWGSLWPHCSGTRTLTLTLSHTHTHTHIHTHHTGGHTASS